MRRKIVIVEQSATSISGHYFMYSSSLALAAHEAGHDVTVLCNKRFDIDAVETKFQMRPTFTCTWGEAESRGPTAYGAGHLGYELDGALRQLGLGPDDLVIIHTCGYVELAGLLEYFTDLPPDDRIPVFHLILRYDPQILVDNWAHYRRLFEKVRSSRSLQDKILFHSDTDLLSREFEKLTGVRFGTCPIPFDQTILLEKLRQRRKRPSSSQEPLNIVYLGDARQEKGYQHIPSAVANLWGGYVDTGRVRFFLQSNFNTPGGEPGILDAQIKLAKYGDSKVELFTEPLDSRTYYSLLADADILIIPYSAQQYRFRSSGVLIEAMTAGKPVVTTENSWMATRVAPDHAILYGEPSELGPAIAAAVERYAELAAGAAARQPEAMAESEPAFLLNYILQATPASSRPPAQAGTGAPLALVVLNGDAIALRNGASFVFASQLRYLDLAGYRIVVLLTSTQSSPSDEWKRTVSEALRSFRLERVSITCFGGADLDLLHEVRFREWAEKNEHSLLNDIEKLRSYTFDGELTRFLAGNRPDCILLNYITNYPLVEMLGLQDAPIVCEIHDIQSFQRAIYGRRPVCKRDLAVEFEMLAKCDFLVSLNEQESGYVRDRGIATPIVTNGPLFDPHEPEIELLAGVKDLAELVSATNPKREEYQFERAWATGKTWEVFRLQEQKSLDLIFVSSAHMANVTGLRWFLEEVYRPYLAECGVSLVVAGSIAQLGPFPRFDKVFYIDRVADLDPLYAAARIVILPISEGAGSPIKTAEALSKCKPIVATTFAMRDFNPPIEELEIHDDAEDFARAVLRLVESPEKRLEAARISFEAAKRLNSFASYAKRMNGVFTSVLGPKALSLHWDAEDTRFSGELREWTSATRAANRIIRAILGNEAIEFDVLSELAKAPDRGASLLRKFCAGLLAGKNAPILATEQRVVETVSRAVSVFDVDDVIECVRIAQDANMLPALASSVAFRGVVINRRAGLEVCAKSRSGKSGEPTVRMGEAQLHANTVVTSDSLATSWRLPYDATSARDFALLALSGDASVDWTVVQSLAISGDMKICGRRLLAGWRLLRQQDGSIVARLATASGGRDAEQARKRRGQGAGILNLWRGYFGRPHSHPLFDAEWYLAQYPDVKAAAADPLRHYLLHGVKEKRNPNPFFDTGWYLERYSDVVDSGHNSPIDHYLEVGAEKGYDPSPSFSSRGYLDANPDVRAAGVNPLWHYLQHGRSEGREALPFDANAEGQTLALPTVAGLGGERWFELEIAVLSGSPQAVAGVEIVANGAALQTSAKVGGRHVTIHCDLPRRAMDWFGWVEVGVPVLTADVEAELVGVRIGWTSSEPASGDRTTQATAAVAR